MTAIQGNSQDAFVRFNDQDGNKLVALNKDGSVSTTGIQFSDGTTQDTAGGGGSGSVLVHTVSLSQADVLAGGPFDIVPGVANKVIVPIFVTSQCLANSNRAYSGQGLGLTIQYLGDSNVIGAINNQSFSLAGQDSIFFNACVTQFGPIDQTNAIGNPLQLVNNGNNFAGGTPVGPFTVGASGGSGYAPGDTGTWGQNSAYTYTVLTVDGGGAVLTFSVNTSSPDFAFVGDNPTSVSTGGGDYNFLIHVPTVTDQGNAPIQITTTYILVDASF